MAQSVFGSAIDYARVRIRRRKWFPLQPRRTAMAPQGHIHFHPTGGVFRDDFSTGSIYDQALLIHELTHVWQAQRMGRWYLVLMRHPFCRYDYAVRPGWPLARYGIEQQAEIVKHTFMLRHGALVRGAPALAVYESILPFESG